MMKTDPMRTSALKRYFFTGLFVLIPIGASALIVTWLFKLLDGWTTPITQRLVGYHIPGLGIVITGGVILLTGILSSNVIGRWFLRLIDHLLLDVPIIKTIYNTTKQVMQVFAPGGEHSFRSVVLVDHPRTGQMSLGFVTHELDLLIDGKPQRHLAVYLPTNHFYLGDTFFYRADQVRKTPLSVQEGIQSAISAGATLPPDLKTEPY